MSEGLKGVVVSHGDIATALVKAAEQISGITGVLVAISNSGCDRELISRRIAEAVGAGPAVVFVDLPSGSCLFGAMTQARGLDGVRVVTGVNLPMLLDFIFHLALPPDQAAARAVTAGGQAIRQL